MRLSGALLGLLALGCAAWAVDDELDEQRAITELQMGGHIVYLRHADRLRGPREGLTQWSSAAAFADCQKQRNLTAEGQEQARALGEYWRKLDIPVGRVVATALCRTRDTAILAFGRTELDPRLYDLDFLRRQLLQPPTDGTNTVIVGSDYSMRELAGIDLGFTEAVLLGNDGAGNLKVVARLDLDDWEDAAATGWWSWF